MKTRQILQHENADQAAHYLAQQLYEHASSPAIVVAASPTAIELASTLANLLVLPLEIIPTRIIRHPGNSSKVIGSVTVDEFEIDNDLKDIPQDYISHQLLLTQASVRKDYETYYADMAQASFRKKTIILVDDVIGSAHPMASCLKSIKRQQPEKIIVAALYVTAEAVRRLGAIADQLTFFEMIQEEGLPKTGSRLREQALKCLNKFRDEHALV
jgi:putative phosphoribosyl transferase